MIERIVYTSKATAGLEPKDVFSIIRTAHNRNSALKLTGILVLIDGFFLQVLEGEEFRLRERLNIIEQDKRHTDLLIREHSVATERMFPNDWMALRQGQDVIDLARQLPGYAPGFPASTFSANDLLELCKKCYEDIAEKRMS